MSEPTTFLGVPIRTYSPWSPRLLWHRLWCRHQWHVYLAERSRFVPSVTWACMDPEP